MVHSIPLPRLAAPSRRARFYATALLAVSALGVDAAYISASVQPITTPASVSVSAGGHAIDAAAGPGLQAATVARQRVVGGGHVTAVTENVHSASRYRVTVLSQATHYTISLSPAFGVLGVHAGTPR